VTTWCVSCGPKSATGEGRVIRWDPSRRLIDERDLSCAGGFDAVINLAGAGIGDKRWSTSRKQQILRSRVDSTTLLVEALRSTSTGTAVLASGSAIGYYGSRGDKCSTNPRLRERFPRPGLCPVGRRGVRASRTRGDGRHAAYRITMGEGGGALKRQLASLSPRVGGPLSTGKQWLSPISLVDEVRAITLDRRPQGVGTRQSDLPLATHELFNSQGNWRNRFIARPS